MLKRVIAFVCILVLVACFSSCDSAETGVVVTTPIKVAVGISDSPQFYAAHDYTTENGYELIEYETMESAIVSVENGKADFVVISSADATNKLLESTSLEWVENTSYKIDYCAYFNKSNESLKKTFDDAINELKKVGVFDAINNAYAKGENYQVKPTNYKNGTLRILCSPVFDKLLCFDEKGNLAGKEISVINEICAQLSMKPEIIIVTEFDELLYKLDMGEGDVVLSAMEFTEERKEMYLCSDTYMQTTFGVYKRKTS